MRATCLAYLILLDFTTLILFGRDRSPIYLNPNICEWQSVRQIYSIKRCIMVQYGAENTSNTFPLQERLQDTAHLPVIYIQG
jgi:hypothetical protein